jgi:glycosyltransferase involved in cell wall biosynthesis
MHELLPLRAENMADKPRIIIVSSYTSTMAGGEAVLPWHYFVELRRRGVDAHLVTDVRTKDELVALEPSLTSGMHFVPHNLIVRVTEGAGRRFLPPSVRRVVVWPVLGLMTELGLRRRSQRLVREAPGPAVVHQPAPVSPRAPSLMVRVGAPVVIGPLNGGMTYPSGFALDVGRAERAARWLSRVVADAGNRVLRGKPRAALLLVANERTSNALPRSLRRVRVEHLVENGVDLGLFPFRERGDERRRFVFAGRLVDWKRVDLALDALARTPDGYSLDICGSGPLQEVLEHQAHRLGLAGRVTFHGLMTQSSCAEVFSHCDALLLPSVYECGGAVVLEAMASGLPVIATDWGGPADYLDSETAILVPPTSPESVIAGFANAMQTLGENERLVRQLGRAGSRRVEEEYSWTSKIDSIWELYASCV